MRNTILIVFMLTLMPVAASAQFYTITKESKIMPPFVRDTIEYVDNKWNTEAGSINSLAKDTLNLTVVGQENSNRKSRNSDKSTSQKLSEIKPDKKLPELTIPNLYEEILRNGIRHPKIVLAQAILETGWFRSAVCRNKHNLFGLTNPRTGKYYEFGHWTESVRAYYTKVQYRYKGGNYLLWLDEIGYTEDPGDIRSVIRVLKQL